MSGVALSTWLEDLGLGDHAAAFAENEIDWSILPELTNEDLKDLGLNLVGHRRRLLKEIADLSAAQEKATAEPANRFAERRQVSVLFCDMVGSTSLSTQIDAEDLRDVQRKYQDAVATAVSGYGGHIASFVGDGIVVYFGWPIATENQAVQAVRAGLAALEMVSKLTVPETNVALAARAGIATGQVVVGDLTGESSHQSAAISGKAPNRAARLQELAAPGQLTIDKKTKALLGASFDLAEMGAHDLKGLSANTEVWGVKAEVLVESSFDAISAAKGIKPLVGRKADFDLIKDRWDHSVSGEGQAVFLSGEAGIGKSRMIRRLYEELEHQPKTILRYQCSQYLSNAALHPVAGTLERAAGFERADSISTKFDKLEAILQATDRDAAQTAALLGSVLNLPVADRYAPHGMTPQRQLEETLLTLLEQFIAVADTTPALIIFEDLHWADPTTLDLIGRLLVEISTRPIFLLATFRQEFDAPWPAYPHRTDLSLNRMGAAECVRLIDQLTGGKPLHDALKSQIIEKADGVPLFLEELTKAVLEGGNVVETDTGYDPVAGRVDLAIPSTIQATLMARLDRQSPVKNVAQISSCIGREFSYDVLFAIAEMSEAALRDALDQLVEIEIGYCRGTPPSSVYSFKHALLRDAAYDSLLRARKRRFHQLIVDFLEAQDTPDIIGCAYHSAAAGLAERAATYFLEAGRASMNAGTFSEAVSQLRLGLDQIPQAAGGAGRDRLELDLRVALGTAEMALKGWAADEIIEALDPAVPIAKALGDDFALGLSLFSIWIYHATRAEMEPALRWLDEMDAVAASTGNQELQMIADTAASMNLFWIGAFDKAETRRLRTLKDYDFDEHRHLVHHMNHDPRATVLQWSGATQLWCQGCAEQSLAAVDAAIAHARTLENPFSVVFALTLGSLALVESGHAARMIEQCAEASAICDEIGLPFIKMVSCESLRGRALIALKQDEEGVAVLTEATAYWEGAGGRTTYGEYTSRLATALGRLGRVDEALALNEKALQHHGASGEHWYQSETHRIHGKLLLSLPEPQVEAALKHLETAQDLAEAQGALSFVLRSGMTHAEYLADNGQTAEAKALLSPVYARFNEGFDTPELIAARTLQKRLS